MLKVELARVLPSRGLIYLFTFMPGLFFLTAVVIANPDLSSRLASRLQVTIPLGHYTSLFAGLFLAFVVGATFIALVAVIQQLVLSHAWRLWFSLKPILCRHALLPLLNRVLAVPPSAPNSPQPRPKPRWLIELHRQTVNKAFPPSAAEEPAFVWWEAMAKQLLRIQYGMGEKDLPAASLQPLREVLTAPTPREEHGDLMFIALHATGWSALAAAYFAPELRTTWFYVFAFFLIANGLRHDISNVRLLEDPGIGDTLRLRSVLREFPKLKTESTSEGQTEED